MGSSIVVGGRPRLRFVSLHFEGLRSGPVLAMVGDGSEKCAANTQRQVQCSRANSICGGCCSSALLEELEDEMERLPLLYPRAKAVLKSKIATAAEAGMEARGEVPAAWTRPPGRVSFLE